MVPATPSNQLKHLPPTMVNRSDPREETKLNCITTNRIVGATPSPHSRTPIQTATASDVSDVDTCDHIWRLCTL